VFHDLHGEPALLETETIALAQADPNATSGPGPSTDVASHHKAKQPGEGKRFLRRNPEFASKPASHALVRSPNVTFHLEQGS
jgi:hypothetical protein